MTTKNHTGRQRESMSDKLTTMPEDIASELEKSNSTQLKQRVGKILLACERNEKVQFSVEVKVHYAEMDLTSVEVTPDTNWMNENELGSERFHFILGPRGGVRSAERSGTFVGRTDYADRKWAFRKATNAIERAI